MMDPSFRQEYAALGADFSVLEFKQKATCDELNRRRGFCQRAVRRGRVLAPFPAAREIQMRFKAAFAGPACKVVRHCCLNSAKDIGRIMQQSLKKQYSNRGLDEAQMKALFLNHLLSTDARYRNCILSSEFVFDDAARRADLVVLFDGKLIGIEIKSDRDSLKRLDGQMEAYLSMFDEVILVVSTKHLAGALCLAPGGVSVYSMLDDGEVRLVRAADDCCCTSERRRLLSNFSKQQLQQIIGVRQGRASKAELLEAASALDDATIRDARIEAFKMRFGITSSKFWRSLRSKPIEPGALATLSRYAKRRRQWSKLKKSSDSYWANWSKSAEKIFAAHS